MIAAMATSTVLPRQRAGASDWLDYFNANRSDLVLPWDCPYRLTSAERKAVLASIQQFQLGESGDGRRLLQQAEIFAEISGSPEYVDALRLFVREEQRHSRILGRFLDIHGCPRLGRHWVQGAFRRIRGLAGFELRMRVLATAEVLAMPFYAALREATGSPLLRAICELILAEETAHLRFQSFTLSVFDAVRAPRASQWHRTAHRVFLDGTALVVWRQHLPVFRAAGWSLGRVRKHARDWFERMTDPGWGGIPAEVSGSGKWQTSSDSQAGD